MNFVKSYAYGKDITNIVIDKIRKNAKPCYIF